MFKWNVPAALCAVLLLAGSALGQNYPLPASSSEAAAVCAGCAGNNSDRQPNAGKPTYQYSSPLVDHVGRIVDSYDTINVQNAGIRTVRGRAIRISPDGDRIYVALGEAVGAYSTSTFFSSTLPKPTEPVSKIPTGNGKIYNRSPLERIAVPDAFYYPESRKDISGWTTFLVDSQQNLGDFDSDDRDYFYGASRHFGWGIHRDDRRTNGTHLPFVYQDPSVQANLLVAFRSGASYYVLVSDYKANGSVVFDVTNPSSPSRRWTRNDDDAWVIAEWSRDNDSGRIALLTVDGEVRIYTPAQLASAGTPSEVIGPSSSGRKIKDISFDENGALWIAEGGSGHNVLWKVSASGTKQSYDVYGSDFDATHIRAGAGYIAVGGIGSETGSKARELRLLKVEGSAPRLIDTDHFFTKYYHRSPTGYARPEKNVDLVDLFLIEQGAKTYLFYNANGLADVYEIEGGESINASLVNGSAGTPNPNARPTETGPFYGDFVSFRATSSNPSATYDVKWDFKNPEADASENKRNSNLGQTISHQFTGLNTAAKISATKSVTATASIDEAISDVVPVTLKVPKARITVPGLSDPIEVNATFHVVAGDVLKDASDGVIEGHYSEWKIDNGTPVKLKPNQTMPVGALGEHDLSFYARYGKYDDNFESSSPFTSSILTLKYTVLPFLAVLQPITTSGTNYVFSADARATSDTSILSATQWVVTWTLVPGGTTAAAVETLSESAAVGTIPDFPVAKSLVTNGSVIKLSVVVPPTGVSDPDFATFETEMEINVPDPEIQKTSGCENAGEPCTLTAVSKTGAPTSAWQLQWTIKRGSTTVKTGTTNPITFTPSDEGTYTATVVEKVFDAEDSLSFGVDPTTCGGLPGAHQVTISASCIVSGTCTAGEPIHFRPSFVGYDVQDCDTFLWNFGDGSTSTDLDPEHTYSSNKNYTVKFTISNSSGNLVVQRTISVGGDTPPPPPPPVCEAPSNISFTYSGTQGCKPGTACKTNEQVTFTARRGGASLHNCDETTWTIDGSTSVARSPKHTFTTTGNKTVSLVVKNDFGTSSTITQTIPVVTGGSGGECNGSAAVPNISIGYVGAESGCRNTNETLCRANEQITFRISVFQYELQACDRFEWNFGDGSALATIESPSHAFAGTAARYTVSLKVYNSTNPAGAVVTRDVPFSNAPVLPTPVLSAQSFPTTGSKDMDVTFTVTSNIPAKDWAWDFGDGGKTTQAATGTSSTVKHKYTRTGSFTVTVKARNAQETSTTRVGQASNTINITDVPEYQYLLPVVTHIGGEAGSVWRTDVQVYTPDPNISATNPLNMTARLKGAGGEITRTVTLFDSTKIYEDFMQTFTSGAESGPVVITARTRFAPQIWTRTYNQAENGTFGQFIPAIRIDAAGGGSAIGTGNYYLAGLRHDARFRTNIGFVNPNAQALIANVSVFDDRGFPVPNGSFTRTVQPLQLDQFSIGSVVSGLGERPFSVRIEVPAGQWLVAYASFIDKASNDPVYVQAVRASDLASEDNRTLVIPGVGHVGEWRSDVSVFNPNGSGMIVDLEFFDQGGTKIGSAPSVPISGSSFLQYDDLLKQGVFGTVNDALGILKVTVPQSFTPDFFPLTMARTYNDNGTGKTFGQGIRGIAAAQANVKPGKPALVPGVRSNDDYYTNVGLTNVSSTDAVVTVKALNPVTGAETAVQQHTIRPNQSIVARLDLKPLGASIETASLKIEVTGGNVWAFASIVDDRTKDPEYVPATPLAP